MGSGQGARLCVWRSRQGLTDTDWTSQLGTLSGLQRDRGSRGAECRRSIQRGVWRGVPVGEGRLFDPHPSKHPAIGQRVPRQEGARSRRLRLEALLSLRLCWEGLKGASGGPESPPRAVRGTLVPPEGATWGGCWRATGLDDVPRVELQGEGAEFEALAADPGAPDAVCGAQGAAGLRPLRIGLAGAATG